MRRRRPAEEPHESHERWLVSYADFITLLFAFFVVMYSLSSVNEGKYRILSESLVQAFRSVNSNDAGQQFVAPPVAMATSTPAPARDPQQAAAQAKRQEAVKRMKSMAEEIRRVLAPLTSGGQVSVTEGAFGITVEINASALFGSGDATLGGGAASALGAVAKVLAPAGFPVTVEGHTDNTPINTPRFPSNWELSAVRASSVVRLFVDAGVAPDHLTAAGYGDQRPVADNATEAGRARNRRVTIRIESMLADDAPAAPGHIRPDDPIRSVLPGPTASR